ncbi:MAG: type II CAAX endopeptidase family protein [Archangium sp.]|nr:type II CAAX endopeptidase family protein [Archangium sp.]
MIDSPPEPPLRPTLNFTVAWTVFALITFLLLGFAAQMMQLAWGLWFSEIILFAGLSVIGFQLIGFKALRAMGLHRFEARAFGLGFAFGLLNYFAWAVPLMAAAQAIFPQSMVEQFDSSQVFERSTQVELALVLLGVSIAAPLGEELLFRGFFQRGVELHRGAPRAIVLTAFIFSAFHLDPVGLTARFELGVLFGLLAWRAGSLWPAIAAHAANNLISSVIFLSAGDSAKEADLVWWVPVLMLLIGNAGLFVLVRKTWHWLPVAEPMAFEDAPSKAPARLFLPWVAAGLVSIGFLLAVDLRGVQLNLLEVKLQPGKIIRGRDDVKALRAKVRSGDAELQEYEALVRSLTSPGR